MTTLIVALPSARPETGTEFSYALSDGGSTLLDHGSAAIPLLPESSSLVLVVPARCLSWHVLKLPPVAASRLRGALDGALEERLLDEPAALALAVGPRRGPDGELLVAACDKSWLRAALECFEQAKRPATRVVPQFSPSAEPEAPPRAWVMGSVEEASLVLAEPFNVACVPLAASGLVLPQAAADGEMVQVAADPAVAGLAEQALGRPVTLLAPAQSLLDASLGHWDLAQFDLAISSGGRMARRSAQAWQQFLRAPGWRMARWGLAGVLLANLIGLNAWAWQQDQTLRARREQVRGVLLQTFPQVRTVVDAPLQMERELTRLRQTSGALSGRDLEVMLAAVGAALPASRSATSIDYVPGELVLKGVGLDPAQSALVSGKLGAQAYTVRMEGERMVVRAGAGP